MFAALEARSMIFGAIAFFVYACAVCQGTMRYKLPASIAATASILTWLVLAIGLETAIGNDHPHRSGQPGRNQMA
jgi:hypothetical protein